MTTFVLVHGAYHGAWCWHEVVPRLADRGHEAVPVELPAHGIDTTPPDAATMADYVAAVTAAIDEADGEVALVGHSMAGMVVSAAAEARPDAVGTLVYLTAYLPADGDAMFDHRVPGSPISRAFVRDEDAGVGRVERDALADLFYADCSPAQVALARSLVRGEPLGPLAEPVALTDAGHGSVRRVFVRCTEDRVITPEKQAAMVDARGVDAEYELPASHSPFLSMPERLVETLADAAA
ncbi:alpha/beta fold hydrolase [Halosegnis marinus]|uniref:Alpha/beta fold hydrolase n=1 Tax=Halosegnis marinus TaxID=3034023 RepID=A0ABD5ZNB6_9EURY|nr:alpha/beta fold hydrolase [Halosegnis sp. DT85]